TRPPTRSRTRTTTTGSRAGPMAASSSSARPRPTTTTAPTPIRAAPRPADCTDAPAAMAGPGDYRAPCWLPGAHAQTIWPAVVAPRSRVAYRRERWEAPDGDWIDLDHAVAPTSGE